MDQFRSDFRPEVRKVRNRLGTLEAACIGLLPNLPYLPYLFHLRTHTYTHTRTRAHACVPVSIMVRKVRKVRKSQQGRGFQLPNLLPTSIKVRNL